MRTTIYLMSLIAFAFVTGCPKEDPPKKAPEPVAVSAPKEAPRAEPPGPAAKPVPDGGSVSAGDVAGQNPKVDPSVVMYDHMDRILAIIAKHAGDCDRTVALVHDYVGLNATELKRLKAEVAALRKSMTPEEEKEYNRVMMQRGQKMIQGSMQAMMGFGQACPEHMSKIGEAMKRITD